MAEDDESEEKYNTNVNTGVTRSKPPEISREHPALIVFLIDQSSSMLEMLESLEGEKISKAEGVARAINKLLSKLITECARGTPPSIRDYFHICVIGYGYAKDAVGIAFQSEGLKGKEVVVLSELPTNFLRIDEKTEPDRKPKKIKIWFEPVGVNGTPMHGALEYAYNVVSRWLNDYIRQPNDKPHNESFPPIVLNITDGDATDAEPDTLIEDAQRIKELRPNWGNVFLFNLHLSSTKGNPCCYPSTTSSLPKDEFAELLFNMSSEFIDDMIIRAKGKGYMVEQGARGFVFNGSMEDIWNFIVIGTQPAEG